jgi:hypothetical protein
MALLELGTLISMQSGKTVLSLVSSNVILFLECGPIVYFTIKIVDKWTLYSTIVPLQNMSLTPL